MKRLRQYFAQLRCGFRGHQYDAIVYMPDALYFCSCCGRELLNRSFDDIQPLTDAEVEELHRMIEEARS
jgi:hypothetical protein